MKLTALATVLALVPMLASSYPSAFSLSQYSERVYKREASRVHKRSTEFLSRSARQANQDDEDNTVQTLIKLVGYTLYFHGCPFDPKGDRFINEIKAANTAEFESETTEVKLIDHIAALAARVVTSYGCAGFVTPNTEAFQDRFKAAQFNVFSEPEDINGPSKGRSYAVDFLVNYGCKYQSPNSSEFIIAYLSTLFETIYEEDTEGLENIDRARIHYGKLIAKVGCANPDPFGRKFKQTFDKWVKSK